MSKLLNDYKANTLGHSTVPRLHRKSKGDGEAGDMEAMWLSFIACTFKAETLTNRK